MKIKQLRVTSLVFMLMILVSMNGMLLMVVGAGNPPHLTDLSLNDYEIGVGPAEIYFHVEDDTTTNGTYNLEIRFDSSGDLVLSLTGLSWEEGDNYYYLDNTALDPDSYELEITVYDETGLSESRSTIFQVRNEDPVISINAHEFYESVGGLEFTIIDPSSDPTANEYFVIIEIFIGGDIVFSDSMIGWISGQAIPIDITGLAVEEYLMHIEADDGYGGYGDLTDTFLIIPAPNLPPEITINQALIDHLRASTGNDLIFTVTDDNSTMGDYQIDLFSLTPYRIKISTITGMWEANVQETVNFDGLDFGTYEVRLTALDEENMASDTYIAEFEVFGDNEPPEITVIQPPPSYEVGSTGNEFIFSVTDDFSTTGNYEIDFFPRDKNFPSISGIWTEGMQEVINLDGRQLGSVITVTLTVYDDDNATNVYESIFEVYNVNPVIQTSLVNGYAIRNATIPFSFTVTITDNSVGTTYYNVQIDGEDLSIGTWTSGQVITITFDPSLYLVAGIEKTIIIFADDGLAGETTIEREIVLDEPPEWTINIPPSDYEKGSPGNEFVFTVIDDVSASGNYHVRISHGVYSISIIGTWEYGIPEVISLSNLGLDFNTYRLALSIEDNGGEVFEGYVEYFTVYNLAPRITITGNLTYVVGTIGNEITVDILDYSVAAGGAPGPGQIVPEPVYSILLDGVPIVSNQPLPMGGFSTSINIDGLSEGEHILEVIADDDSGGVSTETEIITVTSLPLDTIFEELYDLVANSPDECWKKPQRKTAMLNKLDALWLLIEGEEYAEAYDKLLHDIKPKLTGLKENEFLEPFGTGIFKCPWLICPDLQAQAEEISNRLLTELNNRIDREAITAKVAEILGIIENNTIEPPILDLILTIEIIVLDYALNNSYYLLSKGLINCLVEPTIAWVKDETIRTQLETAIVELYLLL